MSEPTLRSGVRFSIYQRFLEDARPPVVEELMATFDRCRDRSHGRRSASWCEARSIAVVKGHFAHPDGVAVLGDRDSVHRPTLAAATISPTARGMRSRSTPCSANEPIAIDSFCHHCGRPIRHRDGGGHATHVEPESTIVYLALRPTEWWEDIITTCSNTMVFFCSAEHRDASGSECDPADTAASLTPRPDPRARRAAVRATASRSTTSGRAVTSSTPISLRSA